MINREDVDRLLNKHTPAELFLLALCFEPLESLEKKAQLLKDNPDVLDIILPLANKQASDQTPIQ